MNKKELLENLDGISINQSAKNKIRKMIEKGENVKERKGEREELAKMIAVELKEIIPDSKQWLEVLKQLKIPEVKTPKVPEVKIPEIKIPDIIIPEIKIPKIEVPKIPEIKIPEVKIPEIKIPKIETPSVNIPKEMEVKGIKQFFEKTIKSINEIIKNKFSVVLHGGIDNEGTVERDNPLPVIPVDENGKTIKGGGGIGFVKGGGMAGGATEEKQDDMITGLDNVEILKNRGTISTNNSTTTPLGIDEVFTGVADDIKDFAAINISIWADQASAIDGLSIEWSQDGTNWDEKMTVAIGKEKAESYEFGVRARYFRLVYTNGAIAQTAFRLQVIFHPVRTREGARCLCIDIDPREFAKSVRAVLAAKMPNGTYTNIHATAGKNLKVSVEEFDPSVYKTTLIDDYTTANKTYIGKAVAGASEGALVWQIKCLDETGNFLKIGFADGSSDFKAEWDERTTYSYT